jgi:plasmid stabilization system protein ParE
MKSVAELRFTRHVSDDLVSALNWYDRKSTLLGDRFQQAVDAAFTGIKKSPQSYPIAFPDLNVRFYRIRRFPYLVLYREEEAAVLVIGVWHGASDPQKWLDRIQEG